jgi:hypothetical protein
MLLDMAKKHSGWPHVAVLLLYSALTLLMTWPLAANLTTAIPGDGFDGWQNYWNQWWLKVALVDRQQNPYFTDLLFHPTGVGLYFHTLNPFNGLATLPIQLSLGLIPAYNAVVLLSWILGGYGVYLLTLWILRQSQRHDRTPSTSAGAETTATRHSPFTVRIAAFIAGLIFTFSPFHMAHLLGHMQVMAFEWIPFYVLYLLRSMQMGALGKRWLQSALMAGLFLILSVLCDWYFVLYLFLFTLFVCTWRLVIAVRRHETLAPILLTPVVAGLLFVTMLAPILTPMVRETLQFRFMVRPATDLYILSASLIDFLIPNRLHTLFRPASFAWAGNQMAPVSERTISIGYVPLLLVLAAIWGDRRRAVFWLACGLFFLLLALGPRLHWGNITAADIPSGDKIVEQWTPYALLNRFMPVMRIARSVSRYALMVQLSLAVAAGIGLAALIGVLPPRRKEKTKEHEEAFISLRVLVSSWLHLPLLIGVVATAVVLAEYWVAPYPISPPDTPPFYAQLRTMPEPGAVLNLPMNYDRPGYLLYQTVHQRPLTVAYISRDDPRTLTERAPVLQHFRHLGPDIVDIDPVAAGATILTDLEVGFVVLDRYKMPGGLEREYTEQLAANIFAGRMPIFSDERITVYRVTPPAQPAPYLVLGPTNWGALQQPPDAPAFRQIGAAPAQVSIHHAPVGVQLRVRYRTAATSGITVTAADGGILAVLPPAPERGDASLALGSSPVISVMTDDPHGAFFESLKLIVPDGATDD